MKKLALAIIVVLAVGLRLYRISSPVADWHSWRQSDTAAVARNFLRFGIDPLRPRYDDLSNIQSGKDNPRGWRMVEFPLYQTIGAYAARSFPSIPLELWLRIITIAASSATVLLLGNMGGVLAAFLYAVLPYSVYYGRSILPEPLAVFWAMLSLWLMTRKWTLASAFAGAMALLTKPTAAFLLVPIPWLLYKQSGVSRRSFIHLFVYSLISLLPFILWRRWIVQFPEGIPASSWLFNGNGIRFKGAWFWWLFAKRLGELILGFWGLVPFVLGLKNKNWFFRWWIIGALLYFVVFATGNVQHDYYQILIIPAIAVYLGKGLRSLGLALGAVSVIFMLSFSWYTVRTYYWINRPEIVEAGKEADRLLPQDAKVVAPYNGDTTFLYQTKRQGWPLGFDIEQKISMGATHYVTVSPTDADLETKDLAAKYTVLVRNDKYAIIDLTKPQK